jgi:hypothetical protein
MVPWMTMVMLTTPFTAALYSYERFGLALFLALLGAILRVGSVLLCFVLGLDPVLIRARGWFQPLLGGAPRMIAASAVGIMILVAEGTVY